MNPSESAPTRTHDSPPPPPPPPPPPTDSDIPDPPPPPPPPPEDHDDAAVEAEQQLMAALGLPTGFASTKGKQVEGADVSGARIVKRRKYRQYMNRRGGFNRPLDGG